MKAKKARPENSLPQKTPAAKTNHDSSFNSAYEESYAVTVLIITPQGIPLIRDPKKTPPVFWKAPGGRSKAGETAEATAIREVKEEIGITLQEKDLVVTYEESRGSHVAVLFTATLASLEKLRSKGDENEEIRVFSPQEVRSMPDLFPNHRRFYGPTLEKL